MHAITDLERITVVLASRAITATKMDTSKDTTVWAVSDCATILARTINLGGLPQMSPTSSERGRVKRIYA
jgi:hypothetical protein